jgi:hypothetical protein
MLRRPPVVGYLGGVGLQANSSVEIFRAPNPSPCACRRSALVEHLSGVRLQSDSGVEVIPGLRHVALRLAQKAAVVESHGVIGLQVERRLDLAAQPMTGSTYIVQVRTALAARGNGRAPRCVRE